MTYFAVLATFIGPPLVVLMALAWIDARSSSGRRRPMLHREGGIILLAHVVIALVYTTPWDNYLVATNVWWYDEALVTGVTLGYVPIEEYVFFIVQTLLTGLWLLALRRYLFRTEHAPAPNNAVRRRVFPVVMVAWIASMILLFSGWKPGTYLALELSWALLPVLLQVGFGADILWARRGVVLAGILPVTLYLSIADAIAIESGTWTIDPAQSTGIMVGGVLPVEEVLFFFLTNTLIVLGMTLMLSPTSQQRARTWINVVRQRVFPAARRISSARR